MYSFGGKRTGWITMTMSCEVGRETQEKSGIQPTTKWSFAWCLGLGSTGGGGDLEYSRLSQLFRSLLAGRIAAWMKPKKMEGRRPRWKEFRRRMLTWRDAQTLETRPPVGLLCCVFPDYVNSRRGKSHSKRYKIHETTQVRCPRCLTSPARCTETSSSCNLLLFFFQTEEIILLAKVSLTVTRQPW